MCGVGGGLVFQQGHVAFLKAFPELESCGDYSLANGNLAPPEKPTGHIKLPFCVYFFISKLVITELQLEIVGLEGNQVFLISISQVHLFQDLTFGF